MSCNREPIMDDQLALIEETAQVRVKELEYALHHLFNTHTAVRMARGIMTELEMPILPEMVSKIQKVGDAEKTGQRMGYSTVLSSRLMGDNGPLYLQRVRDLFLSIVEERVRMRDETRAWEQELRLAKIQARRPPTKAQWKSQQT